MSCAKAAPVANSSALAAASERIDKPMESLRYVLKGEQGNGSGKQGARPAGDGSARAGPDVQAATALSAGLPGVGLDRESGFLEGTVVDDAADVAQVGQCLARVTGFLPCFLQRAAVKLDLEFVRRALHYLGGEDVLALRNEVQEGVLQPLQVCRGVRRENIRNSLATLVDRPLAHLSRLVGAELRGHLLVHRGVDKRTALHRVAQLLNQQLFVVGCHDGQGWAWTCRQHILVERRRMAH